MCKQLIIQQFLIGLWLAQRVFENTAGDTGVYLNDRELSKVDLVYFQTMLGYIRPGYYWLEGISPPL